MNGHASYKLLLFSAELPIPEPPFQERINLKLMYGALPSFSLLDAAKPVPKPITHGAVTHNPTFGLSFKPGHAMVNS